jgi:uncharacterized Zn-binding protein involved in type VI secretion
MPPAARIGDQIGHGPPTGTVGPPGAAGPPVPAGAPMRGVGSVRIGGLPAAVVGTVCACASPVPPPPHGGLGPGNVVLPGPAPPRGQVLIGGFPAARMGDRISCTAVILTGATNVIIGG